MGRFLCSWCLILIMHLVQSYEYTCPSICTCTAVERRTDCRNNQLTQLPEDIYLDVRQLDLSYNDFTEIPPILSLFKGLEWLDLSFNKISAMSQTSLLGLENLRLLDLSNNHFTTWSDIHTSVLLPAVRVEALYLSHNSLKNFPDITDVHLRSQTLQSLHLVNCSITNINSDILEGLSNITILDLSGNNIETLNAPVKSKTLRVLNLSNSGLQRVYDPLAELTSLTHLWASKNTMLRHFYARSGSLEILDLSDCDLDSIPKGSFPRLRGASFRTNHIRQLPSNSFESIRNIRSVDISHNAISAIAQDAFHDTKLLHYLDLSFNTISNVHPKMFSSNFKLREIRMSHNYLREVVNLEMESLEKWDLSMCEINRVHRQSLAQLPALQHLNLSRNPISYIPDDMEAEQLVSLDLSQCRISGINNRTFASMPNLRRLSLKSNRLTSNVRRAFFFNINELYLSDNSWRCDCSDYEFRTFYEWLISGDVRTDKYDLICQSPENVEGLRWGTACYESWTTVDSKGDHAWMYSLIFVLALVLLFCVILSIKRVYRLRELREMEMREQNIAEARERLQRMRIQEREARIPESTNAPDPRELQRPPSYAEAISMPRLDMSHPSLVGSRGSLTGSRHSLRDSNTDLKTSSRTKRRKRRKSKSASAECLSSSAQNTTEQSASDTDQAARRALHLESNV